MRQISSIRKLFYPIQPTVKKMEGAVIYEEAPPSVRLRDLIYCYWLLKTEKPLQQSFTYRVVADGCIDVFFDVDQPHESFVMGFCQRYTEFQLQENFQYAGIRFLPTMFPQLFKVDAGELSNKSVELQQVVPGLAEYLRKLLSPPTDFLDLRAFLDAYFLRCLGRLQLDEDARFYNALDLLLAANGTVRIEKDLQTGLSPRQLRRKFNYYIGTSPKTFGKVVRFQNILKAKPSTRSLRENKLFFDAGYYDQAHFTKEFKHLYGVSPSTAFGRS